MKLIHLGLSVSRLAILVCAIIAIQSGIAHAQSTYDSSTGALINAYQVDGYTGMRDLAVSGNKLLIADSRHIGVDEIQCADR